MEEIWTMILWLVGTHNTVLRKINFFCLGIELPFITWPIWSYRIICKYLQTEISIRFFSVPVDAMAAQHSDTESVYSDRNWWLLCRRDNQSALRCRQRHHHSPPMSTFYRNKCEFRPKRFRCAFDRRCNEWTDSCSKRWQSLYECWSTCDSDRVEFRPFEVSTTWSTVAATTNLGRNIYFHCSVPRAGRRKCRALTIHVSTALPMVFLFGNLRLVNLWVSAMWFTERTTKKFQIRESLPDSFAAFLLYSQILPFWMLIQNCFSWSSNGRNVFTSNVAVELQNAGPIVPNRVGQTPWIVQISFGDGSVHEWDLLRSIHDIHPVTGQTCVNINKSNAWLLSAMNWTSSSLGRGRIYGCKLRKSFTGDCRWICLWMQRKKILLVRNVQHAVIVYQFSVFEKIYYTHTLSRLSYLFPVVLD